MFQQNKNTYRTRIISNVSPIYTEFHLPEKGDDPPGLVARAASAASLDPGSGMVYEAMRSFNSSSVVYWPRHSLNLLKTSRQ